MDDCKAAQESKQLFHYSWLIILMAFVTWKETKPTQFLTVRGECRGVHYENLWVNLDADRQRINNHVFFTYYQQPCVVVASQPRITKDLTNMYRKQIHFMVDLHHIYNKSHNVKKKYWYTSSYLMV